MNTQNVNVNTATPESPKTWGKTPESVCFTDKMRALTELAHSEGEMLFYRALSRLGLAPADPDAEMEAPAIALDNMERLAERGGIDSPAAYDLVQSVDALIKAAAPDLSRWALAPLREMQAEAAEIKAQYLNGITESFISEDIGSGRGKAQA